MRHFSASSLVLASLFLLSLEMAIGGPVGTNVDQTMIGQAITSPSLMRALVAGQENGATCYDPKLASFINYGLKYFGNNMSQMADYILNQIKLAKYSGYWFVHAQMIGRQQAFVEWGSLATGDIFATASRHGCYYNDGRTYIVILQY